MPKNDPVLFTDALKKECSHEDYINFDEHGLYAFPQTMTPDFMYGADEYKAVRAAQETAKGVAHRIAIQTRLWGFWQPVAIKLARGYINTIKCGQAPTQDELDIFVAGLQTLSAIHTGAAQHDMAPVDFIDMVLNELVAIAKAH